MALCIHTYLIDICEKQTFNRLTWQTILHLSCMNIAQLMPSSHLSRTLCDKFVYDFQCDFWASYGYGLRHMCSHCLRATRGKSVQRLCGDCTEIVQCQCSCPTVSTASARKLYGARAGIGLRTAAVWGLCNATYDMSTVYGLTIFFQICKTSR